MQDGVVRGTFGLCEIVLAERPCANDSELLKPGGVGFHVDLALADVAAVYPGRREREQVVAVLSVRKDEVVREPPDTEAPNQVPEQRFLCPQALEIHVLRQARHLHHQQLLQRDQVEVAFPEERGLKRETRQAYAGAFGVDEGAADAGTDFEGQGGAAAVTAEIAGFFFVGENVLRISFLCQ